MSKNPNKSSSCVKATRQGKDTEKRKILLKASLIAPGIVQVSLWDKRFEIGSLICPVEVYGLHDSVYSFLGQILKGYLGREEFLETLKKERK